MYVLFSINDFFVKIFIKIIFLFKKNNTFETY